MRIVPTIVARQPAAEGEGAMNAGRESMAVLSGRGAAGARRSFVAVQATKALAGAVLAAAFVAVIGPPDVTEALALIGLLTPAVLAVLALTRLPLSMLETAALALFAALIGYLVALTGGCIRR